MTDKCGPRRQVARSKEPYSPKITADSHASRERPLQLQNPRSNHLVEPIIVVSNARHC